ncbi:MAG: hypothetical protein HY820_12480 [Acidobacteria bacterium]|nr:hypothetical protein [Acidobacteriota bacterium]
MSPVCLFPDELVQDAGFGPEVNIIDGRGTPLLLTLSITRMMEQHTLSVAIWGSTNGRDWGGRPLVVLPNRCYCGEYTHMLDLSNWPEVRFLKVEYNLTGWGFDERVQVSRFGIVAEPTHELAMAAGR